MAKVFLTLFATAGFLQKKMKTSLGINVVLSTIIILEATAIPFAPTIAQGYYNPQNQWNTQQPNTGLFNQPAQPWTSQTYQQPLPTYPQVPIYTPPPLGLPQPTNTFKPTTTYSFPSKQLTTPSQPVGFSKYDTKLTTFDIPIPDSKGTRTIQLPLMSETAKYKVYKINPDEPASVKAIPTDILKPVEKADEGIKTLEPLLSEIIYEASHRNVHSATQSATSNNSTNLGNNVYQNYKNLGGTFAQGSSNSFATSSSSDTYKIPAPIYNANRQILNQGSPQSIQSNSHSNAQTVTSNTFDNKGGLSYLFNTNFNQNNGNLGKFPIPQSLSTSDSQATTSTANGITNGANNVQNYLSTSDNKYGNMGAIYKPSYYTGYTPNNGNQDVMPKQVLFSSTTSQATSNIDQTNGYKYAIPTQPGDSGYKHIENIGSPINNYYYNNKIPATPSGSSPFQSISKSNIYETNENKNKILTQQSDYISGASNALPVNYNNNNNNYGNQGTTHVSTSTSQSISNSNVGQINENNGAGATKQSFPGYTVGANSDFFINNYNSKDNNNFGYPGATQVFSTSTSQSVSKSNENQIIGNRNAFSTQPSNSGNTNGFSTPAVNYYNNNNFGNQGATQVVSSSTSQSVTKPNANQIIGNQDEFSTQPGYSGYNNGVSNPAVNYNNNNNNFGNQGATQVVSSSTSQIVTKSNANQIIGNQGSISTQPSNFGYTNGISTDAIYYNNNNNIEKPGLGSSTSQTISKSSVDQINVNQDITSTQRGYTGYPNGKNTVLPVNNSYKKNSFENVGSLFNKQGSSTVFTSTSTTENQAGQSNPYNFNLNLTKGNQNATSVKQVISNSQASSVTINASGNQDGLYTTPKFVNNMESVSNSASLSVNGGGILNNNKLNYFPSIIKTAFNGNGLSYGTNYLIPNLNSGNMYNNTSETLNNPLTQQDVSTNIDTTATTSISLDTSAQTVPDSIRQTSSQNEYSLPSTYSSNTVTDKAIKDNYLQRFNEEESSAASSSQSESTSLPLTTEKTNNNINQLKPYASDTSPNQYESTINPYPYNRGLDDALNYGGSDVYDNRQPSNVISNPNNINEEPSNNGNNQLKPYAEDSSNLTSQDQYSNGDTNVNDSIYPSNAISYLNNLIKLYGGDPSYLSSQDQYSDGASDVNDDINSSEDISNLDNLNGEPPSNGNNQVQLNGDDSSNSTSQDQYESPNFTLLPIENSPTTEKSNDAQAKINDRIYPDNDYSVESRRENEISVITPPTPSNDYLQSSDEVVNSSTSTSAQDELASLPSGLENPINKLNLHGSPNKYGHHRGPTLPDTDKKSRPNLSDISGTEIDNLNYQNYKNKPEPTFAPAQDSAYSGYTGPSIAVFTPSKNLAEKTDTNHYARPQAPTEPRPRQNEKDFAFEYPTDDDYLEYDYGDYYNTKNSAGYIPVQEPVPNTYENDNIKKDTPLTTNKEYEQSQKIDNSRALSTVEAKTVKETVNAQDNEFNDDCNTDTPLDGQSSTESSISSSDPTFSEIYPENNDNADGYKPSNALRALVKIIAHLERLFAKQQKLPMIADQ